MSTFKFTKLTQLCSFFPGEGEHFNNIFQRELGWKNLLKGIIIKEYIEDLCRLLYSFFSLFHGGPIINDH